MSETIFKCAILILAVFLFYTLPAAIELNDVFQFFAIGFAAYLLLRQKQLNARSSKIEV